MKKREYIFTGFINLKLLYGNVTDIIQNPEQSDNFLYVKVTTRATRR